MEPYTTVNIGWGNIPDWKWLKWTAYPFDIGSQNTTGIRPYSYEDLIMSPKHILPLVLLPALVVATIIMAGK